MYLRVEETSDTVRFVMLTKRGAAPYAGHCQATQATRVLLVLVTPLLLLPLNLAILSRP